MSEERKAPTEGDEVGRSTPALRPPGRQFGDAEIARILQTAAELQERSSTVGDDSAHGLTIEDLRQVAREAGIDPRFVDIAVSDSREPLSRQGNALTGAPKSWRFRSEIPGEIRDDARDRVLLAVRSAMGETGTFADVYGRMEWSGQDDQDVLGSVVVGVSSRDGTTEIDISAKRGGETFLLFGLGVPVGGLTAGAAVANLLGLVGTAGAPLIAAGMVGVSYGVARLLWRVRSQWWERKLQQKVDHLSSAIQDIAHAEVGADDHDS